MDKHAVASLLLLASLAALIRAPTYVTAASLRGRLHPPASSFYEDAGDYFSNAKESAEEQLQPAAVFKRAPWAPTEIRYDAFVQKLLAGKNKVSGNRDKHSTGASRTDQASFQRLGRSSATHDSDANSHDDDDGDQLNEISKIVKDLARQVDEIQAAVGRMKSSDIKHQKADERSDVEIEAPSVVKSSAPEIASQRDQLKANTAAMESMDLEDLLRDASEILNELNASRVRHRRATKEFSSRAHPEPGRSEPAAETEPELSPRGLIKGSVATADQASSDASDDASEENLQPGSRKDAVAEWLLRAKQAAGERTVRFPLRVESYDHPQGTRATSDVGRLGRVRGGVDGSQGAAAGLQRQGIFVQDEGAQKRDSAKGDNDSGTG